MRSVFAGALIALLASTSAFAGYTPPPPVRVYTPPPVRIYTPPPVTRISPPPTVRSAPVSTPRATVTTSKPVSTPRPAVVSKPAAAKPVASTVTRPRAATAPAPHVDNTATNMFMWMMIMNANNQQVRVQVDCRKPKTKEEVAACKKAGKLKG